MTEHIEPSQRAVDAACALMPDGTLAECKRLAAARQRKRDGDYRIQAFARFERDTAAEKDAEIERLREAIEQAIAWHEEQDKSISKWPDANTGDNGWLRMEHQEQCAMLRAALASNSPVVGEDGPPETIDGVETGNTVAPNTPTTAGRRDAVARIIRDYLQAGHTWHDDDGLVQGEYTLAALSTAPTPPVVPDDSEAFREDNGDKDRENPVEAPTETADRREAIQRAWDSVDSLPPIEFTDAEANALAASLVAGPLPEGYVAVPVEPTDQMTLAGSYAADALGTPLTRTANAYRAMIAARPTGEQA
jgi:hypothetical protein